MRALQRLIARVGAALLTARTLRNAVHGAWERDARGVGRSAPPPGGEGPADARVDPTHRELPSSRGTERALAVLLVWAGLCGFGFLVIYILHGSTQELGATMGGMLLLLAAALILAGKLVVPQQTSVEERDELLHVEQVEEVVDLVKEGGEGISRRGLIAGAAAVAGGGLVAAVGTPLASLGPRMKEVHHTPWHRGVLLVDEHHRPYAASDIEIGSFYTALPEPGNWNDFGAGLLVVKLPEHLIHLPPARRGWAPQGILAYTKICPHAGCAISLYRYPTYGPTSVEQPAFTCPCHYSTFLPGEGGRLIFGPAGRTLSQLPLMIDADGNLRAAHGFYEDVGPSWWHVHRGESPS